MPFGEREGRCAASNDSKRVKSCGDGWRVRAGKLALLALKRTQEVQPRETNIISYLAPCGVGKHDVEFKFGFDRRERENVWLIRGRPTCPVFMWLTREPQTIHQLSCSSLTSQYLHGSRGRRSLLPSWER